MPARLTLEDALAGVQPTPLTAAEWHALHMAARNLPCVCLAFERDAVQETGMICTNVVDSGVGVEAIDDAATRTAPPASASLGEQSPGASLAGTGACLLETPMPDRWSGT